MNTAKVHREYHHLHPARMTTGLVTSADGTPSGLFRISSRTLTAAARRDPLPPSAGRVSAQLKELLETGRVRLQNGRAETVSS